jgi:HK97 family phage major capsid protein
MSLQDLREQRAAKAIALREHVNKKDWNPAADTPIYDAALADIDDLDAKISRIENSNRRLADDAVSHGVIIAAEQIARDQRAPGVALYAKWLRGGIENLTPEDVQIFREGMIRNAQSEGTASQGGYTVATEVATQVLEALKQYGGMRKVAEVIQTGMGNPMQFPTSDGTSEEGEIIAENGTATNLDASFGTVGLPVYKFSSKVMAVPFELLQDSNVDIETFVRNRLVTRLGRITNRKFTVGSGTAEPNGMFTAAGVGRVGANGQTGTVIYDDLVELQHSIDPRYREEGDATWMMHDQSVKVIRKIKDSQGRPIFVPGYEQGSPKGLPDTLLGDPIQINQHAPTMAANATSIAYGDMHNYKIRDVMAVEMFRFTDSAYTVKGQVGFLAWMRSGGNLVDPGGSVKTYQNSAT